MTNTLRNFGVKLAAINLLLDMLKAFAPALIAYYVFGGDRVMLYIAGLSSMLGHIYPVVFGFKGGKGVAATLGLMIAMTPFVGILTALTWLFMAFTFKYSSLSALTALALAPIYALVLESPIISLIYLGLSLLSFYRHKENIKRILKGEESKIKLKRKA